MSVETSRTGPRAVAVRGGRLSRRLVALMAIACGAAVANLYYVQPLLNRIAQAMHVSDGTAGVLVTCTQVGFLLGVALLVPLGDLLERRRLVTVLMLGATAAAAGCAAAPGFSILAVALVALGALSVVAQVLVPLSSALAAPEERGQVVGTVMSGLLIGILLARTLSGTVGQLGGWRLSFALAAVVMAVLALLMWRALPVSEPEGEVRYVEALRSVFSLVHREPLLRQRMALGALGFAGFSVLWTAVAFLLGGAPYHYGEAVIGLFGLAGAAGAAAAPVAGRLADLGYVRVTYTVFLACVLASWGLLALGRSSLVALVAGIILLDLGCQGSHISNQTAIYGLGSELRSRLTTAYMVSCFTGASVGSLVSAVVYEADGWRATCAVGGGLAATALLLWGATARRRFSPGWD
ncbi:MAG: MFS transporter [Solirubrobacterales bacterium]|nr:MFS transporter [Solirubrobacterales bacterium]